MFLHDALGCAALWRDFPEQLAARTDAGVLVYSRAGYGRSEPVPAMREPRSSPMRRSSSLPEVLASRGIERPLLIGHSDGATIALVHAAACERTRGLVLEAPHVFIEDVTLAGLAEARAAFAGGRLRERLGRWDDNVDPMFNRWADTWLDPAFRSWSIEALLPTVRCPTLLIQGEADAYGSLAQVDAIRRGVAGPAEALILPACGHSPHAEAPETVLGAMTDFVRRLVIAG